MTNIATADVIQSPRFTGHETFAMRSGWLKKAVDAVADDPQVFTHDDALTTLGVGKNMVRSIRHWALATGIIDHDETRKDNRGQRLRPTEIGWELFADDGIDPFLEDAGTVWLLHYFLAATSDGPTTWYWTFNHFPESEFTEERLVSALMSLAEQNQWTRVAKNTIERDVHCFIRTYAPSRTSRTVALEDTLDCPLTELGLIHEVEEDRSFAFSRGEHPTLPPHVFAYALVRYWDSCAANRNTLLFDEIAYAPGSPGRVFKLSEGAVTDYLDLLDEVTRGKMGYDVTAGLMQVYRRGDVDATKLLKTHYSVAVARGR